MPLSMLGERVGFELVDIDATGAPVASLGREGLLVHRLAALESLLAEFAQPGLTLRVADRDGWILAAAETTAPAGAGQAERAGESMLDRLYIAILDSRAPDEAIADGKPGRVAGEHVVAALTGRAGAAWYRTEDDVGAVIAVAEPVRASGRTIGAVVLEQGSDRILTLTNAALTRLLNLTLLATALAAAGLLAYATWLSLRIRRLRDAAESAVGRDGHVRREIPGAGAKDELGDLSRSFTSMLGRIDEYTRYLRSLASKLSHELRTPLAVVSTSLENLEHQSLPEEARPL
ncbi:MAG TPA: HAMP domain-containing protein, partial [Gammaproteobacteria bacterium]|nr:HAMP domain-containing protein [Gammaproteobacteria bacterium]